MSEHTLVVVVIISSRLLMTLEKTAVMMIAISNAQKGLGCVEVGIVGLHVLNEACELSLGGILGLCDSKDEAQRILRHLGRASSQGLFRDLRSDCRPLGLT